MKIASTTADIRYLPKEDHHGRLQHVAAAGFKYIDLSFYNVDPASSPFMRNDWKAYCASLNSLTDKLGVQLAQCHLPGGNPLRPDRMETYLHTVCRCLDACGQLGIQDAVIHFGDLPELTKADAFARNRDFIRRLIPAMERNNVNLLIENSSRRNSKWYYLYDGATMKEFIEYVAHPLFHACWDIGHAHMEGHQYEDIMILGRDLRAVHIHDNFGMSDLHFAPFMGTVNMDEVITALIDSGYQGYFTLEADNLLKPGQGWQGTRPPFEKSTLLYNPPDALFDAAERFLFEIAKAALSAYGIYEE